MRVRLLKPMRTEQGFLLPKGTVIEGDNALIGRIASTVFGERVEDEPQGESESVGEVTAEPATELKPARRRREE